MKRILSLVLSLAGTYCLTSAQVQAPKKLSGADERFIADILVVVAHPDDEGAVTPYLARAIYDLHKRVAVVYGTHGDSGGNNYGREHAAGLGDIREMEARESCARMGIKNVWFLDGKDTASQNVLNSLANWHHGASLERLVELVMITSGRVSRTSSTSLSRLAPWCQFASEFRTFCDAVSFPSKNQTFLIPIRAQDSRASISRISPKPAACSRP